jgi:hypothetical protein
VHPDIRFPDAPTSDPMDPKSIRKTKHAQYNLYRELASILSKEGHILAIDTTQSLGFWARQVHLFKDPVVLVHSLNTGLFSPRQKSISHLLLDIKDDLKSLKELSRETPIAVTWDASINACVLGEKSHHECSPTEQLQHSEVKIKSKKGVEQAINDITMDYADEILKELDKSNIDAWFFRTAKLQSKHQKQNSGEISKRDEEIEIISGNDFLGLYEHGMVSEKEKKKSIFPPLALGAGAIGAGFLGWKFRDDISKFVTDTFQRVSPKPVQVQPQNERNAPIEKGGLQQHSPPLNPPTSDVIGIPKPPSEAGKDPAGSINSEHPLDHPQSGVSQDLDLGPLPGLNGHGSVGSSHILIPYVDPKSAYGTIDRTKLAKVNEAVESWPPEKPSQNLESNQLDSSKSEKRKSVSESVAAWEQPIEKPGKARLGTNNSGGRKSIAEFAATWESELSSPSTDSRHKSSFSGGSEFGLSNGPLLTDLKNIRRLSEIEKDLKANGIPEEQWEGEIVLPRVKKAYGEADIKRIRRLGRVVTKNEKEKLEKLLAKQNGIHRNDAPKEETNELKGNVASDHVNTHEEAKLDAVIDSVQAGATSVICP